MGAIASKGEKKFDQMNMTDREWVQRIRFQTDVHNWKDIRNLKEYHMNTIQPSEGIYIWKKEKEKYMEWKY